MALLGACMGGTVKGHTVHPPDAGLRAVHRPVTALTRCRWPHAPSPALPACRLFPGQSVCAYGLNPTGSRFIAQRLVTHVPPPPAASALPEAARSGGLSLVVAAGPFCLSDDLSYSPLEELLAACSGACESVGASALCAPHSSGGWFA